MKPERTPDPIELDEDQLLQAVPVLVRERWDTFAARAWAGFQACGRGAVTIAFEDVVRCAGEHVVRLVLAYVVSAPGVRELQEAIAAYDPQCGFVLLLVHEADLPSAAGAATIAGPLMFFAFAADEGRPTPREAHRRRAS